MTSLDLATTLIRVFEGCRLTSYQDSGGIWTIGFGHIKDVVPNQTITFEEAQALATQDLAPLLKLVDGKPMLAAAGLLSFGYNCGYGSLQHVLAGTAKLSNFIHDRHGNVLAGLVARRDLEAALIEIG